MTGLEESSTVAVAVLVVAAVVILAVIFFVVRFGRRQNYVPLEQQQVWHLSWWPLVICLHIKWSYDEPSSIWHKEEKTNCCKVMLTTYWCQMFTIVELLPMMTVVVIWGDLWNKAVTDIGCCHSCFTIVYSCYWCILTLAVIIDVWQLLLMMTVVASYMKRRFMI